MIVEGQFKTESRRTASLSLTSPHTARLIYNVRHVTAGAENDRQLSDMFDNLWTDYLILFEVLV